MKSHLTSALVSSLLALPLMLPFTQPLLAQQRFESVEVPVPFFNPDSMMQAFVLEAKQISVPGFPHAFNGSLIRYEGRFLMSFRELDLSQPISKANSSGYSNIGLVWLDDDFQPISDPQLLAISVRIEDPRLVLIGQEPHLIFADSIGDELEAPVYRRMYDATLNVKEDCFSLSDIRLLSNFEAQTLNRDEKNWVPFDFDDNLLFAYSINPHHILNPGEEGICRNVATSHFEFAWPWGEPRGGTPALAIDEEQYLGFFHSSTTLESTESAGQSMPHYFMGAYLFSRKAPFTITHISSEPIVGKSFYTEPRYTPYWKDLRVVFPCGFTFNKDHIWLMFGRQDHEIWVAKFDKRALLDSLVAVTSSQFDKPATLVPVDQLTKEAWNLEFTISVEETQALQQELDHLKSLLPEHQLQVLQTKAQLARVTQAFEDAQQTSWGSWVNTLEGGSSLFHWLSEGLAFVSNGYCEALQLHKELALKLSQLTHTLAKQVQDQEQAQQRLTMVNAWLTIFFDRSSELADLIYSSQEAGGENEFFSQQNGDIEVDVLSPSSN